MVTAAAGWKALAAELRSTALSYGRVLSTLTDDEWQGSASAAMASAAMPYVTWMNITAVQAEQTATQAEAAAAAYETAFAATVPPPQIAANRTQLMSLIATNIVGQNTAAIAATEAQYAEMWAQDAAAMYGYAGSSAVATRLIPFSEPQQTTNPSGQSAQSGAVTQAAATSAGTGQKTLSQLTSTVPNTLQSMASPTTTGTSSVLGSDLGGWNPFAPGSANDTTGLNGVMNALFGPNTAFGQFINANIWNTIFSSGFYMPGNYAGTAADFMGLQQSAGGAADRAQRGRPAARRKAQRGRPAARRRAQRRPRLARPAHWAASGRWVAKCRPAWVTEPWSGRSRCRRAGRRPHRKARGPRCWGRHRWWLPRRRWQRACRGCLWAGRAAKATAAMPPRDTDSSPYS